jgi:hypothetical protein
MDPFFWYALSFAGFMALVVIDTLYDLTREDDE